MKKYLICLLAVRLFLVGCKKEQPQMSALNEGCDCAKEVSAEFTMEELATPIGWIYGEKRTNTDTVYSGRNVRFYASEGDADYTWYIGSEVIHDREFYRYFGTELEGQNLPMTLVVNKKTNAICLPNDDGYDSIVKYLTVVPKVTTDAFYADYNPRFEGVFRVKAPNLPDSIDISIDITHYIPGTSLLDRIVIFNHDGLGSSINFGSDWYNYRQIWFDNNYGYTKSYFINNLDKTIELYLECNQGYVCTNYHYKGRKLN